MSSLAHTQAQIVSARKGQKRPDTAHSTETFVTPIVKLSTAFREPRRYLRFQYTKIRSKLSDRASLLVLKFSSPQAGKHWWNKSYAINRRAIRPVATGLHTEMYAAFAAGDLAKLKVKCTDGIFESFRARIAGRRKGEIWRWELLKYIGTPRVVADRAAMVPGMEGMAIRQAVVRIRSQQRLTREFGGKVVEGTGETKDVTEYVVVQQTVQKWFAEGWKVWGTTKATTLEDVEAWKRRDVGK